MHEHVLMRDVVARVDEIARAEGAARVTKVGVRLGALSHFTADHFRAHFADAARGTIAEGAAVDAVLEEDPGDARAGDVLLELVEVELPDGSP
jgi:hydrogenase nickel incorporation protein HypA/HybF